MSLLLDALKEAEARKREATPAVASASATSGGAAGATTLDTPFETDGALALAEELPPEPTEGPGMTSPSTRAAPAPTPAEALLAARAARTHAGASRGAASVAPASAAPAPSTAAPAPAPTAPARPEAPAAARTATPPAATPARQRGLLPWLLGLAGALALLVCGAFLYDALENRVPPPLAAPIADLAAPAVVPAPTAAGTSALPPVSSPPALLDTSATRPTPTGAAAPLSHRRADDPVATPRPSVPQVDPGPRRRGSGAGPVGDAARAAGAGPSDARISISREPAPLDAAWAAQQAGDLDRAATLYRRVLASEQGQVDAQLGLAVIAHARGNDAAARRGYRQVLESAPEHPRAWAGLAELAGEDDAGGIESRLRQLLADRPSGPLHFALGNVLARQERWSDAQQQYFAAATLAPDAPDYAYNVAVALERIGKPAAAIPWYSRALQQAATGRAVRFDAPAARARLDQLQAAPP